ncbi:MAG: SDR family oxidoreductase [Acidobacteria bacterium]|nr:MAG: SDR family oxidoreductase [Acidobacteriota bacterium]
MATVLVTGANRGIGLATSLSLGRAGHRVFATMRNPEGATELADAVRDESLPITLSAMDVDSDASVADAVGEIVSDHGVPEVLVNNAGIERRGSVEELNLAEFRSVMETNYFGAVRCMKAVLPGMRSRGSGRIVNVTSVAGRISTSPLGPYAASKFALEAISEALAQEVKPHGIRVAIVQPGIIDTDMARAITTEDTGSSYPNSRRLAGMFTASLANPTGPEVVADKIRGIIESDSPQLRHPVGPDAEPFLAWRAGMSDEEWVDWGAADDESWYEGVKRDFGLDARMRD